MRIIGFLLIHVYPYELGEDGIKDNIPGLNTDRIFLWIKNDSCMTAKNHKLLSKFKGIIEDDKDYKLYQRSEYKINREITLFENQDIYIQEYLWGGLYLLVEFDKEKIYEKTYQQDSAC